MRNELKEIQKQLRLYEGITELLSWDQETYMPKKGASLRSEQIGLLQKKHHELITSTKLSRLLAVRPKNDEKIYVERLRKDVQKAKKMSSDFIEEFAKSVTLALDAWRIAREENNYKLFEPHMQKIISLSRKKAKALNFKGHPYNGLLDDFEEGMTVQKLRETFDFLKPRIMDIAGRIIKNQKPCKEIRIPKRFQKEMSVMLLKWMDMPMDKFRIDEAVHPFTSSFGPGDVRITTAYDRSDSMFSFTSTAHEAGHALYELGLPEKYVYSVLYDSSSQAMHESQSRFWELMVCSSRLFWKKHYPAIKKMCGLKHTMDEFYRSLNKVRITSQRLEADEITYMLHIILRFELELEMIEGLDAKDLPKRWNEKSAELLGIVPVDHKTGCLQDIHWASGIFGYFPTYALGSIYSAQILHKLLSMKKMSDAMKKGDYNKIKEWLTKNIHSYARTKTTEEIIRKATGKTLSPQDYLDYVKKKYGVLHKL